MKQLISAVDSITIDESKSFRDAVSIINETRSGVALIANKRNKLVGILTDGDIRRAILAGISLDDSVIKAMVKNPITASQNHTKGEVFRIFLNRKISHLPVVDEENNLVGIIYETDLRSMSVLDIPVVIMAGGHGKRLKPLTDTTPKPMLKIGGKPILEIIIEKFRDLGVIDFYISVNYLADMIETYFEDGKKFRVNIRYLKEDKPLGTAGSLKLLPEKIQREVFVINADVLADLDFRGMQSFHSDRGADITVAVRSHDLKVPYGVVKVNNERIIEIAEKPVFQTYINAGIYILNPDIIREIPAETYFGMTDLIGTMLRNNRNVISYLIEDLWIDIGNPVDYEQARKGFDH